MFQNITIKMRLLIYATILIIVFGLMLLLVNVSISSVDDLKTAQTKVEILKLDMLMLRRNEKDFLSRKDMTYKIKFENNVKILLKTSIILKELLIKYDLDSSKVKQFEKIIKQYQEIFCNIVITEKQIGLTPTTGLYGKLRISVHKVQNTAKKLNDTVLLLNVYDLRKQEKDFMLRKDMKYVDLFSSKMDKLLASTSGDIKSNLEKYSIEFLILTKSQEYIGLNSTLGLHGKMRNIVHSGEYLLKDFSKKLEVTIQEKINDYKIRIIFIFIIIMVLIIFISYIITKGILKNLDELSKRDLQILKSEKMASMGEMIGNIAHQWRQPLSVISTSATGIIMQKEYGVLNEDELINTCNTINDNAQYLSKTIDDFKNFIKGDRNKKEFELESEISSFLNLVNSTIKSNEINIILNLQKDIQIDGYKNELIQCFINIFNNAKDVLINKETQNKLIFISTNIKDDKVIIKIKDNAGGIPSEILPKIFDPYFTTKHQSRGTGLGLNMTYKLIVEGMKGSIEANTVIYTYKNIEYKGAEFEIILPL